MENENCWATKQNLISLDISILQTYFESVVRNLLKHVWAWGQELACLLKQNTCLSSLSFYIESAL